MSIYAPTVVEKTPDGRISYDIFSRLTKDRIVMAVGEVNDEMAASIVAQLLFLSAQDSSKEISMYINSPGGSVTAGMSIYDTMQFIPCDVRTIGFGMCASMGSVLLAGGATGKRCILPHTEVMIHQPSGGAKGQSTEIEIAAEHIIKTKKMLTELLAERCNKPYETLLADMDRDHYLNAREALEYGIVDEIIVNFGEKGMTVADITKNQNSNTTTENEVENVN